MTFAERFSQLLQHLLRNLLQRRQSVWKALLWGAAAVVVIGFVAGLVPVGYLLQDLPPITGLHEYQPSLVTRVYSADKQVIGQFFVERRILVPLDKIPRQLVNALVAIEDSRFFEHRGLDFVGIARAAITNLASGKIRQGASTITQQLARSLFLSPKRDFERKAKEALLALKMEQILGKEQILELYLNQIYFGHGAYGVQSAAHTYFGKDVGEITLAEAAYLAGLPKGPADYSPYYHPDASKKRQATVLRRMVEERFITTAEADAATAAEVQFKRLTRDEPAPYFVEHIRQRLMATYGEAMVYKGGLQVYTTLSLPEQQTATTILEQGLRELDKRQGYRGPLRRSASPGEFSAKRVNSGASADAASRPGGIIEAVVTRVEKDGLTVLALGLTGQIATDDLIWARRRLNDADLVWRPENYDQQFYGLSTLRESLVHSRNAATVRLLEKISIPPVLDLARNLGITSPLANDLTLALGSSGVTLQELTAAYGTFFNQGIRLEPYTIESVLDANDKVLETHVPDPRAVMTKESAYLITNMMEDVIQRGTAQAAKDMGRPLAGKTGTTNDFTDAWFVGGAPNLVTGVWVGFDEIRTLGDRETGSRAALPIWMNYMTLALESLPVVPFTMPDGIVEVTIDPATGLLAPEGLDQAMVEVYVKGTEPTKHAEMKSSPSQFFKFDQM